MGGFDRKGIDGEDDGRVEDGRGYGWKMEGHGSGLDGRGIIWIDNIFYIII